MHKLADTAFNPTLPLQTIKGTQQALRCSATKVHALANAGELERAGPGRITTDSIVGYIHRCITASKQQTAA